MSNPALFPLPDTDPRFTSRRLSAVDRLRGLVMILMALDHVRDYVSPGPAIEEQPDVAPAWFLTRFVTHFCAPVFCFLAGSGAWLHGRRVGRPALSRYLFTRGLWLCFLELTVVFVGWFALLPFAIPWEGVRGAIFLQVIWVLGASMILLAILCWLPRAVQWLLAGVTIVGHNALETTALEARTVGALVDRELAVGASEFLWGVLHVRGFLVYRGVFINIVYPLIPWFAVMLAGYLFGRVLELDARSRNRICLRVGVALTLAFLALRGLDVYGDGRPWRTEDAPTGGWIGFLNTVKYPPSLAFLTMTLGPALMALVALERLRGPAASLLEVFGRVPLFFYVVHVPLANLVGALYWSVLRGVDDRFVFAIAKPLPEGVEPRLLPTYVAWLLVVGLLFLPCRWYAGVKRRSRSRLLSYL